MTTDIYAVMGHPVSHSKSPRIHGLFAEATNQKLEYTAIQAPLDGFEASVKAFFDRGGKGLNVTVPFKEQAWNLAQQHTLRAAKAGAVNTLYRDDAGQLVGDNTDGAGLVTDLVHIHKVTLAGRKVLVLGAGGAVRGVLGPLLAQQPQQLCIANRTLAKAQALAELFADEAGQTDISACGFDAVGGDGDGESDGSAGFDVIINGTSASLAGDLPPLNPSVIAPHTVAYDMMYGPEITPFNRWALEHGAAAAHDGLGMLVEQAAESFLVWRGVRPESTAVIEALRLG